MFALAAALLLSAAPGATAGGAPLVRARLLVTEAKGSAPPDVKNVITREVATQLTRYPALEVLSFTDLRRVVELESQRQVANCDEKLSSCVADLQSALGVPWAVFVEIDEVGTQTAVGLSIVGSDGTALSRETITLADLVSAPVLLTPVVRRLVTPLHAAVNGEMPAEQTKAEPIAPMALMAGGGIVSALGVAGVVVGALPYFGHASAKAELAALRQRAVDDVDNAPSLLKDANEMQGQQRAAREAWQGYGQAAVIVGASAIVVGAGAAAAGVVWGMSE